MLLMDAGAHPYRPGLLFFYVKAVASGIDQHHAETLSRLFSCIFPAKDHEGILLVAGSAPLGGDSLDPGHDRDSLRLPLQGMSSVEVDQIIVA